MVFEVTRDPKGFPQFQCPYCPYITLTVKGMEEHVARKHPKMEAVM